MSYPATIHTLTLDTDNGLHTTVHTSAYCAYLALIATLFGNPSPQQKTKNAAWRKNSLAVLVMCESDEKSESLPTHERYSHLADYLEEFIDQKEFLYNIEEHNLQASFETDARAVEAANN